MQRFQSVGMVSDQRDEEKRRVPLLEQIRGRIHSPGITLKGATSRDPSGWQRKRSEQRRFQDGNDRHVIRKKPDLRLCPAQSGCHSPPICEEAETNDRDRSFWRPRAAHRSVAKPLAVRALLFVSETGQSRSILASRCAYKGRRKGGRVTLSVRTFV